MRNQEIVNVMNCINEICESKELKAELKDCYTVISACNKNRNTLKSIYQALGEQEKGYIEAYAEALKNKPEHEQELGLQLMKDKNKLFQEEVTGIELTKISKDEAPVIVKYLSAASTFAFFDFLVDSPVDK